MRLAISREFKLDICCESCLIWKAEEEGSYKECAPSRLHDLSTAFGKRAMREQPLPFWAKAKKPGEFRSLEMKTRTMPHEGRDCLTYIPRVNIA